MHKKKTENVYCIDTLQEKANLNKQQGWCWYQALHGKKSSVAYQRYLQYGRMLQSAVNLHLVPHTLDHAGFVHCFFVNLQMGTTEIIIHLPLIGSAWHVVQFGLILIISFPPTMATKHWELICGAGQETTRTPREATYVITQ